MRTCVSKIIVYAHFCHKNNVKVALLLRHILDKYSMGIFVPSILVELDWTYQIGIKIEQNYFETYHQLKY